MPGQRARFHHELRMLCRSGFHFVVGAGVRHFQIVKPVAFTAVAFIEGILLLPLGEETKSKPCLPEAARSPHTNVRAAALNHFE